ncbi:MAG: glycosyltransferase family 4 protein [Candidatus Bathyarchaeia archaeon]|jgi:glycosyltransferase involved in cell wall biosynthesis
MRVAILTVEFPPTILGGTGTFVHNLAAALTKQGTEVLVITGSPDRYATRAVESGIKVVRFPREPLPPRHFWFQFRSLNSIKKELSTCDVIHGQDCVSFPLLSLCKRSGIKIPWVVTFHTNPLSELYAITHRGASLVDFESYIPGFPLWDMTDRVLPKVADQSVAVSSSLRDELCRTYGKEKEAFKVIHNGINLSDFEKFNKENKKTARDKKIRLFYGGRLYYRKGISHLLRVISSITRDMSEVTFELQVFGRGPLENNLKRYVAQHNLSRIVTFHGHVAREIFLKNMNDCDIVCFPSLYEACPLLMMEAMAMGKPVVAFDRPFSEEIIGNERAKLLASDERDYGAKLVSLMKSEDDRLELGRRLRSKARNFDSAITASLYNEIYMRLFR